MYRSSSPAGWEWRRGLPLCSVSLSLRCGVEPSPLLRTSLKTTLIS